MWRGSGIFLIAFALLLPSYTTAQQAASANAQDIAAGEKLTRDTEKGNCIACHRIGGEPASRAPTVGPVLADLKSKYPDRKALVAAIGELSAQQPNTIMPPYRRNRILTESEIELIAQFLETL